MKSAKHQPQPVCHSNQIAQRLHRSLPACLLRLAAWKSLAASGDWTNNAASVWNATTNGNSNPTVPDTTAGDSVGLTFDITANRTVTIDTTARTLGTLNIGDPTTGYFAYTLAASGGATLTFNNNSSGALLAKPTATNTDLDLISTPIGAGLVGISPRKPQRVSGMAAEGFQLPGPVSVLCGRRARNWLPARRS